MAKEKIRPETEVFADEIRQLIGGVIKQGMVSKDREYYGFIVKKGKKTFNCWVDQDPEGNGAGFLRIAKQE
jgi:hypothetical protein